MIKSAEPHHNASQRVAHSVSKVCIDPGHGGDDRGAIAPGLVEADYTMALARMLDDRIRHSGEPFDIVLTRNREDESVSLRERGRRSAEARADLVLALHVNAGPPQLHGAMCFYWPGNAEGQEVADAILRAMPPPLWREGRLAIATTDRPGPGDDWLMRARNVVAPHKATAVLVEIGFCTSPFDLPALLDPATRSGIVAALMCGLARFRQMRESRLRAA